MTELPKDITKALTHYEICLKSIESATKIALGNLPQMRDAIEQKARRLRSEIETQLETALFENRDFSMNYTPYDLAGKLALGSGSEGDKKTLEAEIKNLFSKIGKVTWTVFAPVGHGTSEVLRDYPPGFTIGEIIIIEPSQIPQPIKDLFTQPREFTKYPRWVQVTIDVASASKAIELAQAQIDSDFDLHRFIAPSFDRFVPHELDYYITTDGQGSVHWAYPQAFPMSTYTKIKKSNQLNELTKIHTFLSQVKHKDEIIRRLRKSISLFGLSQTSHDNAMKYALLVVALEALILPDQPEVQLSRLFAESAAILSIEKNQRYLLLDRYNEFRDIYKTRSKVLHGKTSRIQRFELGKLRFLVKKIIYRVVELYQNPQIRIRTEENLTSWIKSELFS